MTVDELIEWLNVAKNTARDGGKSIVTIGARSKLVFVVVQEGTRNCVNHEDPPLEVERSHVMLLTEVERDGVFTYSLSLTDKENQNKGKENE